jgi:hypothetical protein
MPVVHYFVLLLLHFIGTLFFDSPVVHYFVLLLLHFIGTLFFVRNRVVTTSSTEKRSLLQPQTEFARPTSLLEGRIPTEGSQRVPPMSSSLPLDVPLHIQATDSSPPMATLVAHTSPSPPSPICGNAFGEDTSLVQRTWSVGTDSKLCSR